MRIIDWNSDGCSSDLVVYRPEVPEWALPADLEAAMAKGESIVLLDEQVRIEDGVVHSFSDIAYRIDNPEALTQLGTLKLSWLPDKGDLIVHRLEIVREDRKSTRLNSSH